MDLLGILQWLEKISEHQSVQVSVSSEQILPSPRILPSLGANQKSIRGDHCLLCLYRPRKTICFVRLLASPIHTSQFWWWNHVEKGAFKLLERTTSFPILGLALPLGNSHRFSYLFLNNALWSWISRKESRDPFKVVFQEPADFIFLSSETQEKMSHVGKVTFSWWVSHLNACSGQHLENVPESLSGYYPILESFRSLAKS